MTGNRAYRAAVGVALAAALILIWANLAGGIIGTEATSAGHPNISCHTHRVGRFVGAGQFRKFWVTIDPYRPPSMMPIPIRLNDGFRM